MNRQIRLLPTLMLAAAIAACGNDQAAAPTQADATAPATTEPTPAAVAPAADARQVKTSFNLPTDAILSVRLQPTTSTSGRVEITDLALVSGGVRTPIDLCGDKRLQLVRARKVGGAAGGPCVIEFGDGVGGGWLAPSALRTLPVSAEPRTLEVNATGDLKGAFRLYYDVGNGYRSQDMQTAESAPATLAGG
jgi:hypothetical protein